MKRIFYILLLMINIGVFAQEKQHITVETRGVGVSPDAALKDALSQAVQQAAGTLVDAKTIVKNEEIMEDRVLAASDGFIQSYEKYGEARKNRQGLWTIRIRASVVMKPLKQKLIESRILVQDVGNSAQNQWAQIVSKESSQQDVPAMLEKLLKKYPVESMLTAHVFDEKGRLENLQLYFPEKGRVRDGKVKVSMGVLVGIDREKFQKQFLPELLFLLDKVAPKKSRPFWARGDKFQNISFGFSYDGSISSGDKVILVRNGQCERDRMNHLWRGNDCRLTVNISKGKYRPNIQQFQTYIFPDDLQLRKTVRRCFPQSSRDLKVRLSFLDQNNDIIFYKDRELNYICPIYMVYGSGFIITPEMCPSGTSSNHFFAYYLEGMECNIPLADLKEITKVSASIVKE